MIDTIPNIGSHFLIIYFKFIFIIIEIISEMILKEISNTSINKSMTNHNEKYHRIKIYNVQSQYLIN